MLVVRVKRNREDDPAETLCLIENQSGESQPNKRKRKVKLSDLSLGGNKATNEEITAPVDNPASNRLFLKRISTIDNQINKNALDNDTIGVLAKRTEISQTEEHQESTGEDNPRKKAKVIITQSKRAVPVQGKESCIIVDMMQVFQKTPIEQEPAKTASPAKGNATKILDPATRSLKQGILTAIQRGDFNDISSALIRGANPDYQLDEKDGGYTALMAAALKGNLRMVNRLLLNQVNVLAVNKDGMTALDLIPTKANGKVLRNQKDYDEIRLLLQNAVVKAHNQKQKQQALQDKASVLEMPSSQAQDFVIDVYCVDQSQFQQYQQQMQQEKEIAEEVPSNDPFLQASLIQIEGLKIMDDGNVELFSYDSDWSDLADDEDPDSNDERYYANDYPEESDEDGGGKLFKENEELDEMSEEEDNYFQKNFRKHQAPMYQSRVVTSSSSTAKNRHPFGRGNSKSVAFQQKETIESDNIGDAEDEIDEEAEEEEEEGEYFHGNLQDYENEQMKIEKEIEAIIDANLGESNGMTREALFDRQSSIGKVYRPQLMTMQNDAMAISSGRFDSESLRELWNEDQSLNNNPSDHQNRVQDMRSRTGMLFASNPREFDDDGLPKYGEELSEDDQDYLYQSENTTYRPPKNTIAYDPELDGSDDGEMLVDTNSDLFRAGKGAENRQ